MVEGGVHCLSYTDEQFQWIMMVAEVGLIHEQSSNIECLVDSGAHAMRGRAK